MTISEFMKKHCINERCSLDAGLILSAQIAASRMYTQKEMVKLHGGKHGARVRKEACATILEWMRQTIEDAFDELRTVED